MRFTQAVCYYFSSNTAFDTVLVALWKYLWSWSKIYKSTVIMEVHYDLWPVSTVVQVQRPCGQQFSQLLAVAKVQGEVCSNDGLSDDLQHLLILTGSQVGENIVPFQLWEKKSSIKKQKLHLWGVWLCWRAASKPKGHPRDGWQPYDGKFLKYGN